MRRSVKHKATEQFRRELIGLIVRHGYENDLRLYEILGIMNHVMIGLTMECNNSDDDDEEDID